MPSRLIHWDVREQIDIAELTTAVRDLSANGQVHIQEADTQSDFYAIVLSNRQLSPEELETEWFRLWTSD